jgi:hypothetical protein
MWSLNVLVKKTTRYEVGNPVPGLQQTHKCDSVKPVNGISTPLSWFSYSNTDIKKGGIVDHL